jgi:3-hydroxy acid dehydrogenase / malonic semialdehyde reductase
MFHGRETEFHRSVSLMLTNRLNLLPSHMHRISTLSRRFLSPSRKLITFYGASQSLSIRTMASSAAASRLASKTILITGASSGIGRSTALEFARTAPSSSLRLILTARRMDTLKEIAAEIKSETNNGVEVLPVKLDVSNPDEVRGFVGALPEAWRDIHVLVNNA